MYFKKKWRSMAEKDPLIGHIDIFKQALIYGESGLQIFYQFTCVLITMFM